MAAYPITSTQIAATQTSLWRDVVPVAAGLALGFVSFMLLRRWI